MSEAVEITHLIEALTNAQESGSYVVVDGCYVPPATLERLVNPEPPGDRHNAARTIVASLASQRMPPRTMYRVLVAAYPADDFRDDIDSLVNWVCECGPLGDPCKLPPHALNDVESIAELETKDFPEVADLNHGGKFSRAVGSKRGTQGQAPLKKKASPEAAEQAVLALCGGTLPDVGPKDLIAASPLALDPDWRKRSAQFFTALYPVVSARRFGPETSPLINIVFRAYKTRDGKVAPYGGGLTFTARNWSKVANGGTLKEVPNPEHGALFRINAVKGVEGKGDGSGKSGSYTDADVEVRARMYVLIECDDLPLRWQLAFWWLHREYVAALTSSGGKSLHALLWVGGYGLEDYRRIARTLTNHFRPFGFDATENPSRLSRLPDMERTSKSGGEDPWNLAGKQQLLWLNPSAVPAYKLLQQEQ